MTKKRRSFKSTRPVEFYRIVYDDKADGFCLMDGHGFILEKEETIEVAKGLVNFFDYYNSESIIEYNKSNLNEEKIYKDKFRKREKKNGYVFMYRELGTNLYRLGETKELEKRMKSLNSASPVEIELICSRQSEDIIMLKEYLEYKFKDRQLAYNWYQFNEEDIKYVRTNAYAKAFNEWLEAKEESREKKYITCATCKKKVTELDSNYFYSCNLCNSKFCSENCSHTHSCSPF